MNEKKTNQPTVPSTHKERVQMETIAGLRQAIICLTCVMRSRYEISDQEMFDAVLRKAEKNALHLHFTMQDNYALDTKVRERYERLYTGVLYDRYIKG